MTDKLPKWDDNKAMVLWMHRKLDELQIDMMRPSGIDKHKWLKTDGPEIYYAKRGFIEPLRKKYPHLAPFLFAPEKRKQVRVVRDDAITTAVWAVEKISEIWKREYKLEKRPYRSQAKGQISAVEIAALWMDVNEEDILKRMKPSGPSGKKTSPRG